MVDFAQARRTMVDRQVRTYDVTDRAVLAAFEEVPRERFVPPGREALAYSDQAVPLDGAAGGDGRSLLAPMVLARLLQALAIQPTDRVLDVACGSGYGTLVIERLGGRVIGLEPDAALAETAARLLAELGSGGARIVAGPVAAGHSAGAPYDGVLINGAFEIPPRSLLDQVAERGRLVGIEARARAPKAVLYRRAGAAFSRQALFDAAAPSLDGLRRPPEFVF